MSDVAEAAPEKKIPVMEIFGPTVQGEGAVIGQQTYFIRFGLCDYKCKMCDSMHAVDPRSVKANAEWLTQDEIYDKIIHKIEPGSARWITFSGGNPCIHELGHLVELLKGYGMKIAVETQGTFAPEWLHHCDIVTASPKGPGMGEKLELDKLDLFLQCTDPYVDTCIKIVVFDQRDLDMAVALWERYQYNNIPFYLSLGNPILPGVDVDPDVHMSILVSAYKALFNEIKNHPVLSQMRFLPQWHVFVWGNKQGY